MYEKQMELFEDGGLRDEGGMVDEVSGNDVPVGSTRKEVRDDIPAMLSEGEFVFPADVVRYIGLENLMRVRQDAKQGLKQMDAMGQMGNGDEAVLPDDMPFGMMDLIIVDGEEEEPQEKAQGGVIKANQGTFVTPMFDPSNQDVREYKNAAGDSLFIPFLNGEPVYPIPTGYSPAGQAPEETETEQAIPVSDDSDPPPPPPQSEFQKAGGFGMDTSATDGKALATWIKEAEKAGTVGNVVAGIAAAINPLMGAGIALANKKQKKDIVAMLDEKIAQAQKTPIAGQVEALRELKTRLTTDKGKGILSTAVGSIVDTISGALGFGEEEKTKAKAVSGTAAGQDIDESDDATEQAVQKSLRPELRPDGLKTTAENIAEKKAEIAKVGQESATTMADDQEFIQKTLAEKAAAKFNADEETVMNQSLVGPVDLDRFESPDARQTRAALGFSDPEVTITDPATVAFENFTPTDAEALAPAVNEKLKTDVTSVQPISNEAEELRKSLSNYYSGQSGTLSDFGADATEETIKAYLDKTVDKVDAIVKKGSDAPTVTTTEPVQGGDDDDDGPSFPTVATQEQISQAQEQATNSAIESGATQEEAKKAGTVAGGQMAGKGYVGGYGFNKGGLASRKKKKKK